jgi:hypothetical protein
MWTPGKDKKMLLSNGNWVLLFFLPFSYSYLLQPTESRMYHSK